ncbi:hypothetical protein B9Z55_007857 [Caenorhabditis nigoni]|uniref:Uncharacterized protein n=1 Tax=Caenorhabditis nigoni TaxID=1611254 RepID=A0A2G5VBJ1_9PELO|nr:hypothetical protein B9Z55_007857 [Caenorhabditis nigoni]
MTKNSKFWEKITFPDDHFLHGGLTFSLIFLKIIERKRKSEDAENGTPPKQQSLDSKRGSALDDKQNPQGPSSWD